MINRGVSGELSAQAAARIKNEVALNDPDLVLWQVGTNDALAYVPLDELETTIVDTVHWLKEHKVDVVLVGLQYVDRMAQDDHYKAVRELLRKIAAKENVMIVRRYEAQRLMAQAEGSGGGLAAGRVPAQRHRLRLPVAIHGAGDHARHFRPERCGCVRSTIRRVRAAELIRCGASAIDATGARFL